MAYPEDPHYHLQRCNTVGDVAGAGGLSSEANERRLHVGGRGVVVGGVGTDIENANCVKCGDEGGCVQVERAGNLGKHTSI